MPRFRQYQLVRVVALRVSAESHDGWGVNRRAPRVGDVGALVEVISATGVADRYVVECVSASGDGTTEWLGDFAEDELEPAE